MLKHYVVVRRDLPLGVMAAMVLHAAGESQWRFGQNPHYIAVVLGTDSELNLFRIYKALQDEHRDVLGVTETGGQFDGQLMAIGTIQKTVHDQIQPLQKLNLLKELTTELPLPKEDLSWAGLDNMDDWGV